MTFLDVKAQARRKVHQVFALPCSLARGFRDGSGPILLTARLHDKLAVGGDLAGGGYATIIEGVTRAIFNREELATADAGLPVVLERGDHVTFFNYQGIGHDVTVELDARDPYDGPINERWSVG